MDPTSIHPLIEQILSSGRSEETDNQLNAIETVDLAQALEHFSVDQIVHFLKLLPYDDRAELFAYLSAPVQDEVFAALSHEKQISLLENLASDDRVDLFNRIDPNLRLELLAELSREPREELLKLATYPEHTVGAATNSEYIALKPEMTVLESLEMLRVCAPDMETIYCLYVIDDTNHLVGSLSLSTLLMSSTDTKISQVMDKHPVTVFVDEPQSRISELVERYRLLALPVIDRQRSMLGIVTIDDAIDIGRMAASVRYADIGGTPALGRHAASLNLTSSSMLSIFGHRFFWLMVFLAINVIGVCYAVNYHRLYAVNNWILPFIALMTTLGGYTAVQSLTLMNGTLRARQLKADLQIPLWIIIRELLVDLLLGAVITLVISIAMMFYLSTAFPPNELGFIVSCVFLTIFSGGFIGCILPILWQYFHFKPAYLSMPLVLSCAMLIGTVVNTGLASLFMR